MRIRTGILEIDRLEDESGAPSPPLVKSIDDVPTDAEAVQISAKTRGLADLAARPRLRRVVARAFGDAELEHVGRIATLERLELAGPTSRDLRALRGLSQLRILNVSVAARLESLDGIEKLTQLQVVGIWRTPKLRSIDALAALHELRIVFLAGGMYRPMRIPSLQPLSGLDRLVKLSLSSVRVTGHSLRPLLTLNALRRLDLPLHFPLEEFAMLEQALPDATGQWRDLWRGWGGVRARRPSAS